MNKAAFQLIGYRFDKVSLDFCDITNDVNYEIEFSPSGKYSQREGVFVLTFAFDARLDGSDKSVISIECSAGFKFNEVISFNDIPDYFYPNSIAIIVPYIRAFVSTVSLQANIKPIILPTLNLTGLKDILKSNTVMEK